MACEAKSKELESKQELIYEASKALDTLQLEHEEQLKKLKKEKEKEIEDLTNKVEALEQALKEAAERFAHQPQANAADYEKQVNIWLSLAYCVLQVFAYVSISHGTIF